MRGIPDYGPSVIRNLESLKEDMVHELRQAMWIVQALDPPAVFLEMKIRNVLEYLTGSRL